MSRMKKGEPGHDKAVELWHKSFEKRFGSRERVTEHMREVGRKGGMNGFKGGFASNPNLAKEAGRKGGMATRRRSKNYKLSPTVIAEMVKMYESGKYSRAQIAAKYNLPLHVIRHRTRAITPNRPRIVNEED